MGSSKMVFRTPLCDLLGVGYPVLQSGMGGVAGPDLVAEVSDAGGLGILAGTLTPAKVLRRGIQAIRERTDAPFGVNLLMLPELRSPIPSESFADEDVVAVHAALAPMREALSLPAKDSRPSTAPDLLPRRST